MYLAAGQLFETESLDDHQDTGWIVHNFEVAVFVTALVAWLPRADIGWSLLLALAGTAQILLSGAERWVGAIHGVGALVVLILAAIVAHRDVRGLGLKHGRAGDARTAPPRPLP